MVLLLSEEDVRRLLTMDMALEAVEQVLRKQALEEAQNIPRTRCQTDHAMLHVLSGAAKTLGIMGYKAYSTTRKGANFHVGLFDGKSVYLTPTGVRFYIITEAGREVTTVLLPEDY